MRNRPPPTGPDLPDDADDGTDDPALDADFPLGDGTADLEAEVACPWCGELVSVGLDPGSGEEQEYVEDCQVCCRPWVVRVVYGPDGTASVWAEAAGDWDDD